MRFAIVTNEVRDAPRRDAAAVHPLVCDAARTALGAQSALVYVEKYLVLRTIQMIQQIPLLAFPAKAGIHSAVGTGFRR